MERITREDALKMDDIYSAALIHFGMDLCSPPKKYIDKVFDYVEHLEQQLQHYKKLVGGEVIAKFSGLDVLWEDTIEDDLMLDADEILNFDYKVLVIKQGD